ncbi:hypothetical protein L227DRAFT_617921, partial [Lentinus tigrinus ALCF2SS1-6]
TVARVKEVKAIGVDVGIDFHGRVHKGTAKQLARMLQPLQPMFIEEPLLPTQPEEITAGPRQDGLDAHCAGVKCCNTHGLSLSLRAPGRIIAWSQLRSGRNAAISTGDDEEANKHSPLLPSDFPAGSVSVPRQPTSPALLIVPVPQFFCTSDAPDIPSA